MIEYGGKIYLSKDSLMNDSTFKKMYDIDLQKLSKFRAENNLEHFKSLQSKRLNI